MTKTWLDVLPLWGFLLATLLVVLASIEAGYRLARWRQREKGNSHDAPVSSVIGGMLGLFAFLLAFTFAMTASRFDTRKELLLEEVGAIDTCYRFATLVPEPQQTEIQDRLREYVHIRAGLAQHPETIAQVIARADVLLDELWSQTLLVGEKNSETYALFVESLNEVKLLHRKRIVVASYRIPDAIWLAVLVLSTLSMLGVGYQFGLTGTPERAIKLALALSFSIVIWLIASLERNYEGALQVSQQPMVDLDHQLSGSTR